VYRFVTVLAGPAEVVEIGVVKMVVEMGISDVVVDR